MRFYRRSAALVLVVALLLSLLPLCAGAATAKLSAPSRFFMDVKSTAKLPITVSTQADPASLPIVYKSSDVTVATVDHSGLLTSYKKGMTRVTVRYGKQSFRIDVYVCDKMQSFSDASRYSIGYPLDWKIDDSKASEGKLLFLSPPSNGFTEVFSVWRLSKVAINSLKENENFALAWPKLQAQELEDFNLIGSYADTVNGLTAKVFEYTYTYSGATFQVIDWLVYNKDDLYVLTYLSLDMNFMLYRNEGLRMANTFTILK